ncbi:Inorganic pyrophosphatase [Frankliniella fusca]|uniref:Inorganic pyrophosphatase n=1 Tax=Frankliniella fusca TaxID=407009 RepID=A0AAE1I7F6_9NEOP|nr:Inorganic pyrophosphatase [Frankliniella fusca]
MLPGLRAQPSKLRLKDVNGGVSVLYGPRAVELMIGTPSLDVGKFGASCVYAVARATLGFEIQPYSTTTCTIKLSGPSDISTDDVPQLAQVLRTRCVLSSDGLITWTRSGGRPTRSVVSRDRSTWSSKEVTIARSNTHHSEIVASRRRAVNVGDPVTTPFALQVLDRQHPTGCADDVDESLRALPFAVVVPSDLLQARQCDITLCIVPFAPGLIELEIQNTSGNHVVIKKGSVVACVHPASLEELMACYECYQSAPEEAKVNSASLELVPFTDKAEIQLEPRLPPIPLDQPLPDDLQAMVDRCDLTADQKAEVANMVRQYHDIFVKHNDDFGCCPRGKSTKLYASWEGPYVIIDLLNDCIARIERVQPVELSKRLKPPKRLIVHLDRLAAVGSHLLDQNGKWLTFLPNT